MFQILIVKTIRLGFCINGTQLVKDIVFNDEMAFVKNDC